MTGKVWLVGAGPGDRGLFTLKGLEVLLAAEVVVYDALVGEEVLTLIPQGAELIYVGKRARNHFMEQEEINRLLLRKAQEGKRVVRLKGGDPFLFGRGGEELELLAENGIPFEVVPGVTSAFAVPAYNGIPVTHRACASSVHIITGHQQGGKDLRIDFEALVRTKGTLIFLMGLAALGTITNGLLEAGMAPSTPAAILEKGTTADQRRVVSTLADLGKEAERAKIGTPAIILVGEVCSLAEDFAWVEKRPLSGKRILVTRPKERISELSSRLRREGAEVMELPAIVTETIAPNPELERYLSEAFGKGTAETADPAGAVPCRKTPARQSECAGGTAGPAADGACDWIVFTSPTGVKVFMDHFLQRYDVRDLWRTKLAVIGEGSARALLGYGLKADFLPSVYDGETLGRELREHILRDRQGGTEAADPLCPGGASPEEERKPCGRTDGADPVRILIPRARIGNQELVQALGDGPGQERGYALCRGEAGTEDGTEHGEAVPHAGSQDCVPSARLRIEIADIPTYETVYAAGGPVDAAACVRAKEIDYAVFTSVSTVRGFCASVPGTDLTGFRAVCIGKQTKAAADACGMKTRMAARATIDALVDEVTAAAKEAW